MKPIFTSIGQPLLTAFLLLLGSATWAQQYDLYVYDVQTGVSRQLTHIPNSGSFNSSWSNNGKKIAHDVVGAAAWPFNQSIYVTDVASGQSAPLAGAEGGNDAAWSPDGTTIAFDAWDYWSWTNSLYTVPAEGGVRRLLRGHSRHASWSPGGERVAFADEWFGYIGTIDRYGANQTFVAYGQGPSWSPNGQYIAFNGWGGGVWVVRVDDNGYPLGEPRQLSASGYGPTWKNNSQEVVYIDWPQGNPDLYSVAVEGGSPVRVCGQAGGFDRGDYDPAYSNNGQYLAYSSYTSTAAAATAVTRATPKQEVTLPALCKLEQNYPNPFGSTTRISFQLAQTSRVRLDVYNAAGQKIQTLADAPYQPGRYTVAWNGEEQGGRRAESGLYFCRLQAGSYTQTITMTLVR